MKIFIYGTLLHGQANHHVLGKAKLIEETDGVDGKLYSVNDAFPAFMHGEGRVQGAVYKITHKIFNRLDILEGYPDLYDREIIRTDKGHDAWIYIWNNDTSGLHRILHGSWVAYNSEKVDHA